MPRNRFIQVAQINTRYWAEGNGRAAVVLVHGLGGFVETWLPSFPILTSQCRVYALDLPGHGQTDKPLSASYHVSALAHFVKDFMTTLQIERASLVGYSLGGAIVLQCALQFPHMVEKLVLVDSAGLGKEVTFLLGPAGLPVLGEILVRWASRAMLARGLRLFVRDPAVSTEESIQISYQMATRPGVPQALLKTLRALGNLGGQHEKIYGPIVRGLAQIEHPTLVIWGRQDRAVPVAHAQIAAKGLRKARLHILDNCGHFPMVEQPQAFNQVLSEFLCD